MDPLEQLKSGREKATQAKAVMEGSHAELRQAILDEGVPEHVLRMFELQGINLAIADLQMRYLEAEIENAERMVEEG